MLQPVREKKLVIFSGCHDKPGHSGAGIFALEMNRKGVAVKLFVENLPSDNLLLGIDIQRFENEEIRKPFDIVRTLAALHRVNAFRWSIANLKVDAHREFLKDIFSTAQKYGGLPAPASGLDAITGAYKFLSSHYLDAALRISDLGIMDQMEMSYVLAASMTPSARPIPHTLLEIGRRMLEHIPQEGLDTVRSGLLPDIQHFFGTEYGISVPGLLRDTNIEQLSGQLLSMHRPLDAKNLVADLEADLSVLREFSMAYDIARQEFDYGVVSVSMPHFGLPNLTGLLSMAGMRIEEK